MEQMHAPAAAMQNTETLILYIDESTERCYYQKGIIERERGRKMLKEFKKLSLKKVMPGIIIMMVIACILLGIWGRDVITVLKGPVPFESLSMEELDGQYVTLDLNLTFGDYMEEITTTKNKYGSTVSRRSSHKYYVILVGGLEPYMADSSLWFQYMGIEIPSKYYDEMESVVRNSYKFLDSYDKLDLRTSITLRGEIRPMEDKMLRYYKDFFTSADYTNEEFETYCAPYYIAVNELSTGPIFNSCIFTGIGVLLLIISLYMLIKALTGGYQKAMVKALGAGGDMNLQMADSDYQTSKSICRDFKIGNRYLFSTVNAKTFVVELDKLIWAYTHETQHKKYGRTVNTTYMIMLYTDDKKKESVSISSKEDCQAILQQLSDSNSAIIIGYTDQLMNLYQKNYPEFIRLCQDRKTNKENTL